MGNGIAYIKWLLLGFLLRMRCIRSNQDCGHVCLDFLNDLQPHFPHLRDLKTFPYVVLPILQVICEACSSA